MSSGEPRRSQSATFFNNSKKAGESANQQRPPPVKRQRENDTPHPSIAVEQPSTATLVEEPLSTDFSYLSPTPPQRRYVNKEKTALKLNRLKDKNIRFESHKEFLTNCINQQLIPNGLQLELEPTIGNHNQEFVDKWYLKLKQFSLSLVSDIVEFCDKTITETKTEITTTEASLKSCTEAEEFQTIEKTISDNQEATKRILRQRKFKKFNSLKHNTKTTSNVSQNTNQNKEVTKPSYAEATRPKNFKQNNKSNHNNASSLKEQLQSLHPSQRNKISRPPSRNASNTDQKQDENNTDKEISQLTKRLENLKKSKNKTTTSQKEQGSSKNVKTASEGGREQLKQDQATEVLSMITYIENTMQTLVTFGEKLKSQFDIDLTPKGM